MFTKHTIGMFLNAKLQNCSELFRILKNNFALFKIYTPILIYVIGFKLFKSF